ncbi:hypothetical protein KEM56_006404, partial [Ascosphaera pollenicola]
GSSVDASRIIRADYAKPTYAKLASEAVHKWQTTQWGADGRFTQSGLFMYATKSDEGYGVDYCNKGFDNVVALGQDHVEKVTTKQQIAEMAPAYSKAEIAPEAGYVNWSSGWAHAEKSVQYAKGLLDKSGKVAFVRAAASQLLAKQVDGRDTVYGVELVGGDRLTAGLVMLATGAWSGALIDLRSRAEATGQSIAFIAITDEEQDRLKNMPVMLDIGTGMFIIPPRDNKLKIARHGFGYRNPVRIAAPLGAGETPTITTSVARSNAPLPVEGEKACREGLRVMCPDLADRPFLQTRVCWYTDTPTGDFIISYHPQYAGLFVATGGSGHGFKFLPNIGEKIVDVMEGRADAELADLWRMKEGNVGVGVGDEGLICNDGSRAGARGLVLEEELAKVERSRL